MSKKWMKTVNADFKTDLARGRIGELAMLHASSDTLIPLDGRKADMEIKKTGEHLEVKTDSSYSMNDTPNCFMEVYSHGNKLGGPFRSREEGCKYFAYLYAKDGAMLLFNTEELCERLELLHDSRNLTLTHVGNKNYVTRGLKIHRDWITDLLIEPKDASFKFDRESYLEFINWNRASI